jgi:hypothetical protein
MNCANAIPIPLIEQVLARVSIAWAWAHFGFPGKPTRNCRSPFRPDKTPSFTIYSGKDHERWFDHGDSTGGDVIDFWAKAKGITNADALAELTAMGRPPAASPADQYDLPRGEIEWPADLRIPTLDECNALAALRGLDSSAFSWRGHWMPKVATHRGGGLRILADECPDRAGARRFDGALLSYWQKSDALTIRNGSGRSGLKLLPEAQRLPADSPVEGEPDYFAGLQLCIVAEYEGLGKKAKTFLFGRRP